MANDQITNLAKVIDSGLVVEVKLSRGQRQVLRALTAKRAVYAGQDSTELVNRTLTVDSTTVTRTIDESISALVLSISGDPVTFTGYPTADQASPVVLTVSKLLIMDSPLLGGFTIQGSGSSTTKVDMTYQSEGAVAAATSTPS